MSKRTAKLALLFAALGDETRLALLDRLARRPALSIAELTEGTSLTRQGITKHLAILEQAGLVSAKKDGRELLFTAKPNSLQSASDYIARANRQWDDALTRLKSFLEV
jgi:DNA-binding transcriptional ArsR family regulator